MRDRGASHQAGTDETRASQPSPRAGRAAKWSKPGRVPARVGQGDPELGAVQPVVAAVETPVADPPPAVIGLTSPGRTVARLPTLSRCSISPSKSQLTVCRPVCGCAGDGPCRRCRPRGRSRSGRRSTRRRSASVALRQRASTRMAGAHRAARRAESAPRCASTSCATVPAGAPTDWASRIRYSRLSQVVRLVLAVGPVLVGRALHPAAPVPPRRAVEADHDGLVDRGVALLGRGVERDQRVGLGVVGGRAAARLVVGHDRKAGRARSTPSFHSLTRSTRRRRRSRVRRGPRG